MKGITRLLLLICISALLIQCKQSVKEGDAANKKERIKRNKTAVAYHFDSTKHIIDSLKKNKSMAHLVSAVNRTDFNHLIGMDSIIVPNDLSKNVENYLPFPLQVSYLDDINKIVFFSYPAQSFAAYENGELAYTGQTN